MELNQGVRTDAVAAAAATEAAREQQQ